MISLDTDAVHEAPHNRKKQKTHIHGDIDRIDHEEDAEESLVDMGLRSFLNEAEIPGVTRHVLEECVERLEAVLDRMQEMQVDEKMVGEEVMKQMRFQGMKGKFKCRKPSRVCLLGSAAVGAVGRCNPYAKVGIEIPEACFDEKDYLNHRYHGKRMMYLYCVLTHLKKNAALLNLKGIEWYNTARDPRKPCISLIFEHVPSVIFIITSMIPIEMFPLHKLAPEKNNLRTAVGKDEDLVPTPMYNASIVEDMFAHHNTRELVTLSNQFPAMREVLVLVYTWAKQHGLMDGNDGLTEEFLMEILKFILADGQAMYSVQLMHLFRGVVSAIAKEKGFTSKGIYVAKVPVPGLVSKAPSGKQWRQTRMEVVCIDHTGWINAGIGISASAFQQAQECARRSTHVLSDEPGPEAIHSVFMYESEMINLFDVWTRIEMKEVHEKLFDGDVHRWTTGESLAQSVASRALSDRSSLIRVIHSKFSVVSDTHGRITSIAPERRFVLVCCRLDPLKSRRGVDIGPAANDKMAAKVFRDFWGAKSELRRFQDGKIAEAVIWDGRPSRSHNIVADILEFAFHRHLKGALSVFSSSALLDSALYRSNVSPDDEVMYARTCIEAAMKLSKMLKSLDDLTLRVVNVQPLSVTMRHADVFPPTPHPLAGYGNWQDTESVARCLPAIVLLCQLEGSGKWPDGPAAYQKMKAALGVQLAQGIKTSFGVESNASESFVDVFMSGFAFRLVLYSDRDDHLLRKRSNMKGWEIVPVEDDYPLRQWHQGYISSIAAEHPAYEMAVRLSKLWVARQWLSNHICEESVELLAAAAFSNILDVGSSAPTTPVRGFLSFLELLAEHPWSAKPLVLDHKLSEKAARLHAKLKGVGKAPAMFIVADIDSENNRPLDCIGWTQRKPSKAVLFRAGVLAAKALKALKEFILHPDRKTTHDDLMEKLFAHNTKEYEVILKFRGDSMPDESTVPKIEPIDHAERSAVNARLAKSEAKLCRAVLRGIPQSMVANKGERAIRKDLLIGFDPVQTYVQILEERFGPISIICADFKGGNTIGIKLRYNHSKEQVFDPDASCSVVEPVDAWSSTYEYVRINTESLAIDAIELGAGLVESAHILASTLQHHT